MVFDATDVSSLNTGTTTVDVKNLAQKDAYQSDAVSETTKDASIGAGDLNISINGTSTTFSTTGKTYEELADEINAETGINASLEQVGTDSYRLVLKSSETGLDNALTLSGTASQALGYTTDGATVKDTNHILEAQDMKIEVDGVEYNTASNKLEVDGLTITGTEIGISSINITEDNTDVLTQAENFVEKYNELVALVDEEIYSSDSVVSNKSGLKTIVEQIKDKLFGSYGEDADKSVFNYGFELDKSGTLSIDETVFSKAMEEDIDGLKDLFVGTAENKGFGTQIKELIDSMSFTDGALSLYETSMDTRETSLEEERDKAIDTLDTKYSTLATQFASYAASITLYESSFSGLEAIINEANSD